MHAGEEGHALPGWTTSRHGQDSPWKSQSEWQRTGINRKSTSMVWPTLGSSTAKRTEQNSHSLGDYFFFGGGGLITIYRGLCPRPQRVSATGYLPNADGRGCKKCLRVGLSIHYISKIFSTTCIITRHGRRVSIR